MRAKYVRIQKLLKDIDIRATKWLEDTENRGLLFTKQEIEQASNYVSRAPLLIHIIGAVF